MVRRDGALQVAGVVTWGGETQGRPCGEGPADVSERVLAHLALVTGAPPGTLAPYARRVRVRRPAGRRCVIGAWHPGSPGSPSAGSGGRPERRFLPGHRPHADGQLRPDRLHRDCPHGGRWAEEESYNAP